MERFRRQAGGSWVLDEFVEEEGVILLESLGCHLSMADIYDKVSFEPEADPADEENKT